MNEQASFSLRGRNPDVLTCIANLSNDEVFTPPEFANRMLDTLADAWAAANNGANIWANRSVRFLDPFNKSGVFLREITSRLTKGLAAEIPDLQKRVDHILTGQVFGIGITYLTSLLARRSLYCSKQADGRHSIAKGFRTYDPRRLTGVSVYHEIDREFSVGDRIQFTAPDKSLGVANRDLATIESIAPDGRIAARLDNNREVEFNANDYRHFDHGYAVTSHSSQGLTAERVLVNADTSVHPDLLNSRFGYVSISRASHEATLFTDDMAKLSPQLSADVSKTSALEISQGPSTAQGIGLM